MKRIICLSLFSLLVMGNVNATESFGCFSLSTGDVCVKTDYQEVTPLDAFSQGYWDALIDHAGAAAWDGAVSGAQGVGQDLAIQAAGAVAQKLGVPPAVLSALGFGGGDSSGRIIAEIDRLIQEQTATLLNAMDDNRVQLLEDIKYVLANNCTIDTDNDYDTILRGVRDWSNYEINLKSNSSQITQLLSLLDDLAKIEVTFSENDASVGYCYWGRHVEYFAWAMRLYGLDINTRTAYHNIANSDPEALESNLLGNLVSITNQVDSMIYGFENTQTSELLENDEEVSGDKANVWWDDVVLDSSDYTQVFTGSSKPDQSVSAGSSNFHCCPLSYSEVDPVIADKLRAETPFEDFAEESYYTFTWGTYTINGVTYSLKMYLLWAYSLTPTTDGVETWATFSMSNLLVAEHFSNSGDQFYISEVNHNLLPTNSNFDLFAKDIFKLHMDLEYAQRLQMAYAPYQTYLDEIWDMSNQERPSNKMDREYARTSGLVLLDTDGLSIKTELDIGTDPRNNDSDNDGFDDGFEYQNRAQGFDPLVPHDDYSDADADGASDLDEYAAGTDMFDYEDNLEARAERQRLAAIMIPITALILN